MNRKQERMLVEIREIQVNAELFKKEYTGLGALVDEEAEKLIRDRIWEFIEVERWK